MFVLNFSSVEALRLLEPLVILVAGMVIYAIFIFKFYRFLAKREIFEINLGEYKKSRHASLRKFIGVIAYAVKYVLLYPVFSFFWFILITILLAFLSKETDISSILRVSIALVSTVRVTAYYNEDLSRDLAKMLPFTLLGLFLVDIAYFSKSASLLLLKQAYSKPDLLAYYLMFGVFLELALRVLYLIGTAISGSKADVKLPKK